MRLVVLLLVIFALAAPLGAADPPPLPPQALDWSDSGGSVTLTWQPPASGAPAGYNVYRNGDLLGSVAATHFTAADVGAATYSVTALDIHTGESPPAVVFVGILPCSPVLVSTYDHPPWVAYSIDTSCLPIG